MPTSQLYWCAFLHPIPVESSLKKRRHNYPTILKNGCPVKGDPTPNITWFHGEQPVANVTGLMYHILAAGQILQVANLSGGSHWDFSCLAQNEAGMLVQKASVVIQDYWWSVDRLATCSASCGNRGVQQPRLRCLLNSTEVDPTHCAGKVRPAAQPIACNRRDCPSRPVSTQNCWSEACNVHWRVSLWTLCTATCGSYGFQSRRVECVHTRTNKAVPDHLCSWGPRPANWQRCNITPCENTECRDTTRYCEKVKQLKLCQLNQFKSRCCGTCGKA
ncbi:hypothetical protein FD754_004542 [Muntiacus muntjak]|uniref:PLAC domain-containing protein n=1 Tax=Muntiacus muntjak TaxID=9888 RepID=A0A5N3WJD7_MUNMU|nr:hypothetical protein FD754_004542 [Muntiacus muntjak]